MAHRLNNDLALAVGAIDMLRHEPSMSNELLVHIQTRETPIGPALDLDRSTNPEAGPI